MSQRLARLAEREPNVVHIHELAQSGEQRRVRLVEVGLGSEEARNGRPAMLVVAGIEGNDLVGPFVAVTWLEELMEQYRANAAGARRFETTTIYVVPCLNPDATERFFGRPKAELRVNGTPHDDDRDGLVDEDGGEDLNNDGLVTMMRVEDKEGRYVLDPNDDRLLVEADPVKAESGSWRLLAEGVDNDHDKRWNEDEPGGVNLNRSFPYHYEHFAAEAGLHPVSENATRALADFVVAHPNIGLVLTYGAADNVRKKPPSAASTGRSKPMEAIDDRDVGYYDELGKLYRDTLGLDKELECVCEPGTFSDWMYFHRGRLSLAVRPWDVALARERAKAGHEAAEPNDPNTLRDDKKSAKGSSAEQRGKREREQLKWFDEHAPDAFVQWERIEHPDFPGQRVEVGGYRPFAQTNPPTDMLGDLARGHANFLTALAGKLPRVKVRKIACRLLAESVYEIELHVTNVGFLPTALAHGETTREVYPTRVILDLEPQCFLSGTKTTFLPAIAGSGGTSKVRYTIHAPDRRDVRFEVISMLGGKVDGKVQLLKASESGADAPRQEEEERDDMDEQE